MRLQAKDITIIPYLDKCGFYFTLEICVQGEYAGYATVTRKGNTAVLEDIRISDYRERIHPILPCPARPINYRGKGYGTRLLQEIITYARHQGISKLTGKIVGDNIEGLCRWYRSFGFEIGPDNELSLELAAATRTERERELLPA